MLDINLMIFKLKWIRTRVLPCGCLQLVFRPDGRCQQLTLRFQVVCKLPVPIRPTFTFYMY